MKPKTDPVLVFIREYIQAHQIPPTLREIGAGCHLSVTAVSGRIQKHAANGQIIYMPRQARGLRLVEDTDPLPPAA